MLEVLISIVIFAIALLGLVGMQAKAISYSVGAEDRNQAALLANDMVATMWAKQTTSASALTSEITAWQTRARKVLPPYNERVLASVGSADSAGVVTISLTWTPVGTNATAHTYLTQVAMP